MVEALKHRFGENRVRVLTETTEGLGLILLNLELQSPVKVLMTNGLRFYDQPVPDTGKNAQRVELFFCLPSYWEEEDLDNPNFNWIYDWIQRIPAFVKEKNTWIGHGHTFSIGEERKQLSPNMKQDHLLIAKPLLLEDHLMPIECSEGEVQPLAIIPIFSDEWDYKQGKGTLKLLRKLQSKGVDETLDDFRTTVLKSKWRIW